MRSAGAADGAGVVWARTVSAEAASSAKARAKRAVCMRAGKGVPLVWPDDSVKARNPAPECTNDPTEQSVGSFQASAVPLLLFGFRSSASEVRHLLFRYYFAGGRSTVSITWI